MIRTIAVKQYFKRCGSIEGVDNRIYIESNERCIRRRVAREIRARYAETDWSFSDAARLSYVHLGDAFFTSTRNSSRQTTDRDRTRARL